MLCLHSLIEAGALWQWLCYDDCTMNSIIRPRCMHWCICIRCGLLLQMEWHGRSVCLSVCLCVFLSVGYFIYLFINM